MYEDNLLADDFIWKDGGLAIKETNISIKWHYESRIYHMH